MAASWAYSLFGRALGGPRATARLVREQVRPFQGCRILDIGCGPGEILSYLPDSIGEYFGIDRNPAYIETARRRWQIPQRITFVCQEVAEATAPKIADYDIVLAIAIVHHLNDQDAHRLFEIAHDSLKPGGRFITHDCTYIEGQNRFARWLISRDRGIAVRTPDEYHALARRVFDHVSGAVLHDTLSVPYTIFTMTCTKH